MAADEGIRFALLRRSAFLAGAGTVAALIVLAALAAFPKSRERFLLRLLGFLPQRLRGRVYPFPVAFFVLTWGVLGLAIPTPGGVGGYHKAVAYALTGFYGVAAASAGAFALVSHLISFVPVIGSTSTYLGPPRMGRSRSPRPSIRAVA